MATADKGRSGRVLADEWPSLALWGRSIVSVLGGAQRLGGLSPGAVAARIAEGRVNVVASKASRTVAQILRANVLTRFNAILGGLLVVIAFVGPPQDALFGVVLTANAVIGIVQELRAKAVLDRLALLSAPVAHARRSNTAVELAPAEVVEDDLLELRPGDQLVADGEVVATSSLTIDESLLTGEAVPVDKDEGDEVLSGSIVVSGSGLALVTRVGAAAFAQRLQHTAQQYATAYSELQAGTNRILKVISWVLVPAAALLVTSQLLRAGAGRAEALRGSVAGVGAMVPEGLVLLTTMAFAISALRLARRRVLVQSLPSIEGLARVDVVCIDKTGTLTMPGMVVERLVCFDEAAKLALGAVAASDPAPNATMLALAAAFPARAAWPVAASVPFSSARKWSAVEFAAQGTYVLGAPDVLGDALGDPSVLDETIRGDPRLHARRLLCLARSPAPLLGEHLPAGLEPIALVVLAEHVRPDASDTVAFLQAQGVGVKVLSGDDPRAVAAVAGQVGIAPLGPPRDARSLSDEPEALLVAVEETNIFGRVRPDQKRALVHALQQAGHVVAMTGDGVNDVPALKQADVALAMGSGSQASRAVANLVLLDSAFSAVPQVLEEGRRVIANIERVANLFVTKTVYAALLAVAVGAIGLPYPFYPRQLTIVSSLTIGIPGFFLALAAGAPRSHAGFLPRVLRFTIPAGTGVALATFASYGVMRLSRHAPAGTAKMAAAIALFAVALYVLAVLAHPLNAWRLALVFAMGGVAVAATLVPISRELFGLSPPSPATLGLVGLIVVPVLAVLSPLLARASRRSPARARGDDGARGERPRRRERGLSWHSRRSGRAPDRRAGGGA
ncbi:MAG: HAD-IC family P-type ATPase [Actinomycetota bacterium]|nr:HAD-IC family P-type ATPase [Actinomycetota bacterium]